MERLSGPVSFAFRQSAFIRFCAVGANCLSLMACTKVVEPTQAVQAPAHVGEAARIPQPVNNQGKVNLPARSWGLNQGAEAAPRRVSLPSGGTYTGASASLNGDPGGLNREQLQIALQASLPRLSGCFSNASDTSMVISFDADPSGQVRGVRVRGAVDAEPCVRETIESIRFPRFSGNPVAIDYPINISRTTQTVTNPPAQPVDKPPESVNP